MGVPALIGRAFLAVLVGSAIAYFALDAEGFGGRAWALVFQAMLFMLLGLVVVRLVFHFVRRAVVGAPKVLIVGVGAEAISVAADLAVPGRAQRRLMGYLSNVMTTDEYAKEIKLFTLGDYFSRDWLGTPGS